MVNEDGEKYTLPSSWSTPTTQFHRDNDVPAGEYEAFVANVSKYINHISDTVNLFIFCQICEGDYKGKTVMGSLILKKPRNKKASDKGFYALDKLLIATGNPTLKGCGYFSLPVVVKALQNKRVGIVVERNGIYSNIKYYMSSSYGYTSYADDALHEGEHQSEE